MNGRHPGQVGSDSAFAAARVAGLAAHAVWVDPDYFIQPAFLFGGHTSTVSTFRASAISLWRPCGHEGNLAGFASPVVGSYILQATGRDWNIFLYTMAAVYLAGVAIWPFIDSEKPIE